MIFVIIIALILLLAFKKGPTISHADCYEVLSATVWMRMERILEELEIRYGEKPTEEEVLERLNVLIEQRLVQRRERTDKVGTYFEYQKEVGRNRPPRKEKEKPPSAKLAWWEPTPSFQPAFVPARTACFPSRERAVF